jgi:hypothetical protein
MPAQEPIDIYLSMVRKRYHEQRKRDLAPGQYVRHLNNSQNNLRRAAQHGNPVEILSRAVDMAVYSLFAAEHCNAFGGD